MNLKRTISALLLAVGTVVGVAFCRGPMAIVTFMFVNILALGGMLEYLRMCEAKGMIVTRDGSLGRVFKLYGLAATVLFVSIVFATSYPLPIVTKYFPDDSNGLEYVTLLIIVLGLFVVQSFERNPRRALGNIAGVLSGFVYVPWLFSFIFKVVFFPGVDGRWFLFALLFIVKGGDMLAYVVGSTLGKHKLIPRISPKKTWEGAAGNLVGGLAAGLIIWKWFPCGFSLATALGMAVLLNILSQVGDLAESMLKRDAEMKDSSALIPGVGGALDVLDSLLLTLPVMYFYLMFSR